MILSRIARHLKQQHWTVGLSDPAMSVVDLFRGPTDKNRTRRGKSGPRRHAGALSCPDLRESGASGHSNPRNPFCTP
jgi:hypothetical protein